jgi:hypothetical protein
MPGLKSTGIVSALLMATQPMWALNPHPRIWLTPALIATITAKKKVRDADWLALKSQADAYKASTVPAFHPNACGSNQICYTYQGAGWFDAMIKLALVYRITGDTSYARQAKAVLAAMNAPFKNSRDIRPISIDDGYPTRFVLVALAIGYDWLFDYLDSETRTDTINTINAYYSWYSGATPPYCKDGAGCVYNNYFGGHLLGFGAAADATDGENPTASAIYNTISDLLTRHLAYGLESGPVTNFAYSDGYYYTTGGFQGGGIPESYNYGTNHNLRLWELLWLWKTSGRVDLTARYSQWMKSSARNLLYSLRPNGWQAGDEGDMAGDCTAVLIQDYPLFLAHMLKGTAEGAWTEHLYRNLAAAPCPGAAPPTYEAVMWKDHTRTATDYTQTHPTNYPSEGDAHLYARSDWTNKAVYLMFNGSAAVFAGHQNAAAGNIELQRGNDYLLVDAAQWKGSTGYEGNPSIFAASSQYSNTLYFDDGGEYCYTGRNYAGCQTTWGITQVVAERTEPGFAYQLSDLTSAYDRRPDARVPRSRTARFYYRAIAYLGGNVAFVWDRFRSNSAGHTKRLQWHLNPEHPPSVNGSVISTRTGSSSLFIDTLLPAAAVIVAARDIATSDGVTPLTYNMQVSGRTAGTDFNALTVLYATATGDKLPTATLITAGPNWVGAQVAAPVPLVAVFAKAVRDDGDGTYTPVTYTSTTFTTTHDGAGKYLVAGLKPATYSILRNGAALPEYAAVRVGTDGTLCFQAGAGMFSIVPAGGR